jgi:hypothetical protein
MIMVMLRYRVTNVHRHDLGQAEAAPPAAPATPKVKPRWVNEGSKDLLPTLAAVGTVAAIAIAGIAFLK